MTHTDDLFDGICGVICSIISLCSLIFTFINHNPGTPFNYIPAFIFWVIALICTSIFTYEICISKKKNEK